MWVYLDQRLYQGREEAKFQQAIQTRAGRSGASEPRPAPSVQRPPAVSGSVIGRMVIPRLGVSVMVHEGVDGRTLRQAAGHIPATALPGMAGNVGVAAHRDMFFSTLQGVQRHDRVVFSTLDADYEYEVESLMVVGPDDSYVLQPKGEQRLLTLVTCYPFHYVGTAPRRFVVQARQVASVLRRP